MSELERHLHGEIERAGAISFARFMELALYEPELGYYCRPDVRIGRSGDFVTAPTLSPVFGRVLARLVVLAWQAVGRPGRLRVIDAGGGGGELMAALVPAARGSLPDVELEAWLVERGPAQREEATRKLARLQILADTAELAQLEPAPGVLLANELFDALPVRRLRRRRGQVEEMFVVRGADGGLAASWRPVAEPMTGIGWLPRDREVCMQVGVAPLVRQLVGPIASGLVVVIDYGYPACILRAADGPGSPLRGFRGGALFDGDPLSDPGRIDLTANVDFSAIDAAARRAGLDRLLFTDQSSLLLALGFLDDPGAAAARRLIHPEDMGGAFKALILGAGLEPGAWPALAARDRGHLLDVPTTSIRAAKRQATGR